MLGIADKTLGIAEKCLEEAKGAQQRRTAARQSGSVHISEVLYLWATVVETINWDHAVWLPDLGLSLTTWNKRIPSCRWIINNTLIESVYLCMYAC